MCQSLTFWVQLTIFKTDMWKTQSNVKKTMFRRYIRIQRKRKQE